MNISNWLAFRGTSGCKEFFWGLIKANLVISAILSLILFLITQYDHDFVYPRIVRSVIERNPGLLTARMLVFGITALIAAILVNLQLISEHLLNLGGLARIAAFLAMLIVVSFINLLLWISMAFLLSA